MAGKCLLHGDSLCQFVPEDLKRQAKLHFRPFPMLVARSASELRNGNIFLLTGCFRRQTAGCCGPPQRQTVH